MVQGTSKEEIMRKLGIIQPGKIGDIIICLPIAKYYHDKGYEVIWPVDRNIINNFIGYVDYVRFIPIDFQCQIAHQVCFNECCTKVIDVAFTIPGANSLNSENYLKQDQYTFDEFKYFLADVPFEEKWNLQIIRNHDKEQHVTAFQYINDPYIIIHDQSSDYKRIVEWNNDKIRDIRITKVSESVFDWINVLENAKKHILIESCYSNLIDQLNIKVDKQTLLLKYGYYGTPLKDGRLRGIPTLKLDWEKL